MNTEIENQLPVKELEKVGLLKDGQLLMSHSDATALKRGNITDLLEIKLNDVQQNKVEAIDARLSVVQENGSSKLRVDPVYKQVQDHSLLEESEKTQLINGDVANVKKTSAISGTIVNSGKANYQFDKEAKPNFFVELASNDGKSKHIWGVDLERALEVSGKKIGDRVELNSLGFQPVQVDVAIKDKEGKITSYEKQTVNRNAWEVKELKQEDLKEEKKAVIEYDPQTRQFMHYDPSKVKVPESINNELLTAEQKRKLKEGEVISLNDGTEVQLATADKNGVRSNRKGLILSVLLDGGISYLLITGIKSLLDKNKQQSIKVDDKETFSKGYLTALKQVEIQLERKQAKFPNDKSIGAELSLVKGEFSKASNMSPKELNTLSVKDADDIKNEKSVNDPDHGQNKEVTEINNPLKKDNAQEAKNEEQQSQGRGR